MTHSSKPHQSVQNTGVITKYKKDNYKHLRNDPFKGFKDCSDIV
jgi:hypothetical protein